MSCSEKCQPCKANQGYVCHGDFFTTGEYSNLIKEFDVHGVSFNQKLDSVVSKIDVDTVNLLKVLICDSNRWDYPTSMEIICLLDEISSLVGGNDL